jgi:hypothetical protein
VPRFLFLLWRCHRLTDRLLAAFQRGREGPYGSAEDVRLLHVARRWLACHEAPAAMLGVPEPAQVRQVRIALRLPEAPPSADR